MFFCCCANPKEDKEQDGDTLNINGIESRIKDWNKILIHFVTEEQRLGLKSV